MSTESVDFLDVTVFKGARFQDENILDTKVYFKPTDTHELLHKKSFHPRPTFEGILKSQIIRFYKICNNRDYFVTTCSILFQTLRARRAYSRSFLRSVKAKTVEMLEKCNGEVIPKGAALKCNQSRCECCLYMRETSEFTSKNTDFLYDITGRLTCQSKNIVYLINCLRCNETYVGETSRSLRQRLNNHVSDIRLGLDKPVSEHFNSFDHMGQEDMEIIPILQIPDQGSVIRNQIYRRKWESYFIQKLDTMFPYGINTKFDPNHSSIFAFPITYGATAAKISKLVRETYSALQEKYPKHFSAKFIVAYKRNQNLRDKLVSSKLK